MKFILLSSLPKLPVTRFTRENSGGRVDMPYPWADDEKPFVKRLECGWRVVGWATNSDLALDARRYEDHRERYLAVMFTDPDGFDVFFHMGADYPYAFIQS